MSEPVRCISNRYQPALTPDNQHKGVVIYFVYVFYMINRCLFLTIFLHYFAYLSYIFVPSFIEIRSAKSIFWAQLNDIQQQS